VYADAAFAAVLLVSPHFLNSEFIANEELPFVFGGRQGEKDRYFFWIRLTPCFIRATPLRHLLGWRALLDKWRSLETRTVFSTRAFLIIALSRKRSLLYECKISSRVYSRGTVMLELVTEACQILASARKSQGTTI
jgi:hypothetical protein